MTNEARILKAAETAAPPPPASDDCEALARGRAAAAAAEPVVTRHVGRPTSAPQWDDAAGRSRDTWLYHQSAIVAALAEGDAAPPVFIECRRGGELLGGAIVSAGDSRWHGIVRRRRMATTSGPSWASPFVVAELDAKTAELVLDQLMEGCLGAAADASCEELVLCDSNQSLRCVEDRPLVNRYLTSVNWRHTAAYYWLLDLRKDEETLWKQVATSQRTQIKNARNKLQLVSGTQLPGACEAFIELMGCVNRREGLTLAGARQLRHYWDAIYGGNRGQTFFCLEDGKPCAAAGFARWGKVASYVHAGRSDDAMNGAAALALWSGIAWAKTGGCEWFDLNSMIPECDRARVRALSQFKKRFGGEVIVAQGARIEIGRAKVATCEFIDTCGASVKRALRRLVKRGQPQSASPKSPSAVEPQWQVAWQSRQPTVGDEWDAAVEESRDTWLYHLSRLAPRFLPPKADPLTFLELRMDGKLVGGAIFDILRYNWHRLTDEKTLRSQIGSQTVAPFLIEGLAEKLAETAWQRLLTACSECAADLGCRDTILWDTFQSPRVIEERPIVNRYNTFSAWNPTLAHHYVLDLSQDLEVLFKNVQSRRRTYIRRAKQQFQVVTGREFSEGREAHVALMEALYAREGKVVVSVNQLREIYDAVYDGTRGEAIFLLDHGRPITFTGVARFRNVASYLHGARLDETHHGAHALGFWAGVEWAKAAGCRWFDCNTATFERRGRERMRKISEFKRGFGGFLVHCHGAKRPIPSLTRAAHDFVDAWGVRCKSLFRKKDAVQR